MEELYKQTFGKMRIVSVKGWNRDDVILEDIKSSMKHAMTWDLFFKYYTKIDPYETDPNRYTGSNLSKLFNK